MTKSMGKLFHKIPITHLFCMVYYYINTYYLWHYFFSLF